MIVYESTKTQFLEDILSNDIENIILNTFKKKLGRSTNINEIQSWKNSLGEMNKVLIDEEIPGDAGIAIEYQIPQTSKRIDFIITGQSEDRDDQAILIELKQWQTATITEKDGIVSTFVGGGHREVSHPSYQAWSYAALMNNFCEAVYDENIKLVPCAYLHNYAEDGVISNSFYEEHINNAPLFLKEDLKKLREFIKKHLKYGDSTNVLFRIENGKVRPSKNLADRLASMIQGNKEFVMIDEQKLAFETARVMAKRSSATEKNVLIVEGGPGTGKSVVAINLLIELTSKDRMLAKYVTKNAAPRAVFESRLTGALKKTDISTLFGGSGSYIDLDANVYDALIVDEAHRLNEKSGMFKNKGENQIKEIISAAKFSVFFIDEDQKVTMNDIGTKDQIERWAKDLGAEVYTLQLSSQFRCNGSDGYLSWLDNSLQLKDTANTILDTRDYDFRIIDSPNTLRDLIIEKNKISNKARLVAGYCWEWVSKKNPDLKDVVIPEHNFGMRWNLASDGNYWIIKEEAVSEVGCIHTCQGLEVDYIGVIVGNDFVVRNGQVVTDPSKRAKSDSSIKGYKKLFKENPVEAKQKTDAIIKNTYRTLMTRGTKGCYVYFVDKETEEYFKVLVNSCETK
jgi:DUF2075 family protein